MALGNKKLVKFGLCSTRSQGGDDQCGPAASQSSHLALRDIQTISGGHVAQHVTEAVGCLAAIVVRAIQRLDGLLHLIELELQMRSASASLLIWERLFFVQVSLSVAKAGVAPNSTALTVNTRRVNISAPFGVSYTNQGALNSSG